MSKKFDLWIKGCEINKSDIYPLVGSEDNAVYKITGTYEYKNNYYIREPVVYAVWVYGEDRLFTTDYLGAMKVWEDSQKERNICIQ